MLAKEATDLDRPSLGLMDMTVRRNAYGRQVDSFEADLDVGAFGGEPFHAIFIRAPAIERCGAAVESVATLDDGTIVAAREGRFLATAFHPELTGDSRFHRLFADMAAARRQETSSPK
jgi:5'-phosphate synthase pdxT subunit